MAKLKNAPETYIMDYKRRVGERYERKPVFEKGDLSDETEFKIHSVVESIRHLNKRFDQKDKALKGKGRIENKFIILEVEGKDKAGRKHGFFWNIGTAEQKFSARSVELKLQDFLRTRQDSVEKTEIRDYKDVDDPQRVIHMDFGLGFKVKNVIHRSVITTTPANLRNTTRTMGRRNLHVKRLG